MCVCVCPFLFFIPWIILTKSGHILRGRVSVKEARLKIWHKQLEKQGIRETVKTKKKD